jgi:hypothetical protein
LNKIYDTEWKDWFQNVWSYDVWFIYSGVAAFVVILLILAVGKTYTLGTSEILNMVVFLPAVVAIFEMWPVGTHTWVYKGKVFDERININVDAINAASFIYPRAAGKDTLSTNPVFNTGVLPSWYFDRYVKFLNKTADDLPAQRVLLGVSSRQKVFFSESIDYNNIRDFLKDSFRYENQGHPLLYTGDKLGWAIEVPAAGYVSFIDNWDANWKAYVDGKEKNIELLFGTFKSVAVKEGKHRIEFVYKPGLIYK